MDVDFTNFRDLIDEIVEKCPPMGGDIVCLSYLRHVWFGVMKTSELICYVRT